MTAPRSPDLVREIDAATAQALNGVSKAPRPGVIMYAVLCDGEIYLLNRIERYAKGIAAAYSHSSKHKWDFCRVRVTPIKNRKGRG